MGEVEYGTIRVPPTMKVNPVSDLRILPAGPGTIHVAQARPVPKSGPKMAPSLLAGPPDQQDLSFDGPGRTATLLSDVVIGRQIA